VGRRTTQAMNTPLRIIRLPILAMILLLVGGTAGYINIQGWPVLDSVYMAVLALSTVGFGEVHPLSPSGRMFTIFLIIIGVMIIAWAVRNIVEVSLSEDTRRQLRWRRVGARVRKMTDHFIVCGYGRMGRQIAIEFRRRNAPHVVIEANPDTVRQVEEEGSLCLAGDATEEELLRQAGVERAKGLVTVVSTDAANLFITLSAKQMNPNLFVVARCAEESNADKMRRAGADRVMSPYVMGGRRMAAALLNPTVVEFIDTIMHSEEIDLEIAEYLVPPGCALCGTTIATSKIHKDTGAFVIAVKTASGRFVPTPSGDTPIEGGSTIVAVGTPGQLDGLRKMVAG